MERALEQRKKSIVERLGVYLEKEKKAPPLAARILATLIVNGGSGTTFDQLVTDLEASKSTISTHLTNLESHGSITYFTKCGERKRYYTMKPGYITRKINWLAEQWETEIVIQKELLAYKIAYNQTHQEPGDQLPTGFHERALQFLEDTIRYLEEQLVIYQSIEKQA